MCLRGNQWWISVWMEYWMRRRTGAPPFASVSPARLATLAIIAALPLYCALVLQAEGLMSNPPRVRE